MMSQLYIGLSFALLNLLAYHNSAATSVSQYNPVLPLSIFIFTWINDTGAYCTGMLFGKHRCLNVYLLKSHGKAQLAGLCFASLQLLCSLIILPFSQWVSGLA